MLVIGTSGSVTTRKGVSGAAERFIITVIILLLDQIGFHVDKNLCSGKVSGV